MRERGRLGETTARSTTLCALPFGEALETGVGLARLSYLEVVARGRVHKETASDRTSGDLDSFGKCT